MALRFFSSRSIYLRWLRNSLLVIFSVAALIGTGFVAGLSKSDWAAWVQAVGSILAIIATGVFVKWQNHLQMQTDREKSEQATREKILLLYELAKHSTSIMEEARDQMAGGRWPTDSDTWELADILVTVRRVDEVLGPNLQTTLNTIRLRRATENGMAAMGRMQAAPNQGLTSPVPTDTAQLEKACGEAREVFTTLGILLGIE